MVFEGDLFKVWPSEKRAKKKETRKWKVYYHLAYDGGGADFEEFYRTKFGAYFAVFCHLHFRSWGGIARLYERRR